MFKQNCYILLVEALGSRGLSERKEMKVCDVERTWFYVLEFCSLVSGEVESFFFQDENFQSFLEVDGSAIKE